MIKGISIFWNNDLGWYFGKWAKGRYAVSNDAYKPKVKPKWGIKFDLMIGRMVCPIPHPKAFLYIFKKKYVGDVQDWDKFFGKELADKMRYVHDLNKREYGIADKPHKYEVGNRWYALYWFVIRCSLPQALFSFNTPWLNFYIGSKGYKLDPWQNDYTFCNDTDKARVDKLMPDKPKEQRYEVVLVPSISARTSGSH